MADETQNNAAEVEQVEETHVETDWKAEARKWEKRAKENNRAAQELEELKREQMSELEKAQADAAKAQAEAEQLKTEKALTARAMELNKEHGIPTEMLMHCATVEDMAAFANEWTAYHESMPIHSAPMAQPMRLVKPDNIAVKNGDVFANLFNN